MKIPDSVLKGERPSASKYNQIPQAIRDLAFSRGRRVEDGPASPFVLVQIQNTANGVYTVYEFYDTGHAGTPIATGVQPAYRPFGTSIDFTQYGTTGVGYYDADGAFVLILAIEERYDGGPCPTEPP